MTILNLKARLETLKSTASGLEQKIEHALEKIPVSKNKSGHFQEKLKNEPKTQVKQKE